MENDVIPIAPVVDKMIESTAAMLKRPPDGLSSQSRFFEDLGFDSTTILELLIELETELDFEFDPETLVAEDLKTIETLARYVVERMPR